MNITLDLSIASGGSFHADRRGFRGGDSGGAQSNEVGGSLANYSLRVTSLGKGSPAARGDGAGVSRPHQAAAAAVTAGRAALASAAAALERLARSATTPRRPRIAEAPSNMAERTTRRLIRRLGAVGVAPLAGPAVAVAAGARFGYPSVGTSSWMDGCRPMGATPGVPAVAAAPVEA